MQTTCGGADVLPWLLVDDAWMVDNEQEIEDY
jgi:hypothetical protein